jgi:hypothetical protein
VNVSRACVRPPPYYQALEEKMALMGGSVSPEEAATRVQALVRGFLTRRRIHAITEVRSAAAEAERVE